MLKDNEFSDWNGIVWKTINQGVMASTGNGIYLAKETRGDRYRVSFDIESMDHPCVDLEYLDSHLAETVFHGIKNAVERKKA